MTPGIELFFDYSSPWAYLGTVAARALAAQKGVTLTWRPFLLGALFRDIGTPDVPIDVMSEPKRRAQLRDLERWAEVRDVGFRWPSRFPIRTVKPLRMTLGAPDSVKSSLVASLMNAFWVEDLDAEDDGVLGDCAAAALASRDLVEAAHGEDAKRALRANTDEARERGVPGAPTFFVGDLMFFGQDRLDFVERALSGWRPRADGIAEEAARR